MKIALVDDDRECLTEMSRLCSEFGETAGTPPETACYSSAEVFLEAFDDSFDLVFMDVYMKGMNGIAAALEMRRQESGCLLVFLTSSTDHMPDAFSCHAFEYVTKPFSRERIFHVLSEAVKALPREQEYMEVAADRKKRCIFLGDVVCAMTDAHYLDITLVNGERVRSRMTMPEFTEKTGGDERFLLINKGIAVNAEYVLSFEEGCCIMENGEKFPLRVRDSAMLEQSVLDYNFRKIRKRQTRSSGGSGKETGNG